MTNKILFVANAVKWFDRVNGNTYHSVNITRVSDGAVIFCPFQYGYGDQYKYTAMEKMLEVGWIPAQYNKKTTFVYERENNYPIMWNCSDGLKRDCIANGKE